MTELKQKSFSEWLNKDKAPDKINEAADKIDNTVNGQGIVAIVSKHHFVFAVA